MLVGLYVVMLWVQCVNACLVGEREECIRLVAICLEIKRLYAQRTNAPCSLFS